MDLVEFLRARLDEDEQSAREAVGKRWHTMRDDASDHNDIFVLDEIDEYIVGLWDGGKPSAGATAVDAAHIARHDPARVLAQVAAMRAIVDLHESWPILVESQPEFSTSTDDVGSMAVKMSQRMAWVTNQEYRKRFGDEPPTSPMLRHLASIWSDHPEFESGWRSAPGRL